MHAKDSFESRFTIGLPFSFRDTKKPRLLNSETSRNYSNIF